MDSAETNNIFEASLPIEYFEYISVDPATLLKITDPVLVPLTVFRSNLKFDQTLQGSDLKCAHLITIKCRTPHDSGIVETCASPDHVMNKGITNFIEFRIRLKYC